MIATKKDYFHLHFIVLVWGFTAILGKLISLPAVEMVFYRTLLTAMGIALFVYLRRVSLKCEKRTIFKLILVGFLVAVHWILFFLSARVANVSVCLVGIATTAFWTSLIDPIISRRKVVWLEVVLGFMVIIGLYIIFYYEFELALGLIIAIISALAASIFTIINSRLAKKTNHYAISFFEMSGANLGILLFFPLYAMNFSENGSLELIPTGKDVIYLLLLSFVCTVYAYTASISLMKRISAYAINLTVNMEPVYGIILAFIVFKEYKLMNLHFYIGATLILISVLIYPVLSRYYARKIMQTKELAD